MAHIIYVTGGQRSGKSSFAKQLAERLSPSPVYVATSRVWDEQHRQRIVRHQLDRGSNWTNIEEEKLIGQLPIEGKVALLDCVTLWLTNFFFDTQSDIDRSLALAKEQFDALAKIDCTIVIVSNEIGMGGHPANELQMKFTDLQGWMNQYIARQANEAWLLVSGIPMKIK